MKLNCNYCLMGLLILVLLYCCLGTNLFKENYDNQKPAYKNTPYKDFSHVADDVAREGREHADQEYKEYQNQVTGTQSLGTCNAHQKSGTGSSSDKCPSVTPGNYNNRDSCETGYVWNNVTSRCVKPEPHSDRTYSRSDRTYSHLDRSSSHSDMVSKSQIPYGQKDQYILKSKIVPPVCPACPPVLACPSKGKCPPCPPQEPVQPCPPCARCPRNPFTCKKVPDYTMSNVDGILPRPMLNDFSQF